MTLLELEKSKESETSVKPSRKPSGGRSSGKPKKRRKGKFMLVARRVHLYSGLILVPWVFLYGITGFLFNHPTVGTDRERVIISPEQLEGTSFAQPLEVQAIADAIIEQLKSPPSLLKTKKTPPPKKKTPKSKRNPNCGYPITGKRAWWTPFASRLRPPKPGTS